MPVQSCGLVMPIIPKLFKRCLASWIPVIALSMSTAGAAVAEAVPTQVNIFGDGDPLNGIEDDRTPLLISPDGVGTADRRLNAGTVVCDGAVRGTAMVVDTREFAADFEGAVLLSAAHVFYDLEKQRLFRRCQFHFMGWTHASGYRARIDLGKARMGDFDPAQVTERIEFGQGDWAFLYLRRAWKNYNPAQSISLRTFVFAETEPFQQQGGGFRLVAYDSAAGVITESRNCTVIESQAGDLGGGAWKGQLLDDCDSADGASGGGIIAALDGRVYLIGIRSGSHWSELVYPARRFPTGPPDGAQWDSGLNTNFGRAVDERLLGELLAIVQSHSR